MNWIDRRFGREHHLNNAPDVWQKVSTAIDDACKSFNERGEFGKAETYPQNGHRILVIIEHEPPKQFQMDMKRRVTIAFEESAPRITVTVDALPAKTFPIEADEQHCFLKWAGAEISPDDFSKIALEDALFKKKSLPPSSSPPPKVGEWS